MALIIRLSDHGHSLIYRLVPELAGISNSLYKTAKVSEKLQENRMRPSENYKSDKIRPEILK